VTRRKQATRELLKIMYIPPGESLRVFASSHRVTRQCCVLVV
jgi:hypothetical protein